MVIASILEVTKETVSLACQLQGQIVSGTSLHEQKLNKEEDLLKNVQEVFGAKMI